MKKWITMLLVAVMCLSMTACGGNSKAEKEIVGEWKSLEGVAITFNEDGTGTAPEGGIQWNYDKEAKWYEMSYFGMLFSFSIETEDEHRFISLDGVRLYAIEDYEELYPAYREQQEAEVIEGKTEIVPGETYTTASGIEFTMISAEITGEDSDCTFDMMFSYEGSISLDDVEYRALEHWSGFGIGASQPYDKNGEEITEENLHRHAGGFEDKAQLEADREEYGYLTFSIEGVGYYVSIDTFFE